MNIYVYTYMHTITSTEKRGHEFEEEWIWVYGKVWREQRKGDVIILQLQNFKK